MLSGSGTGGFIPVALANIIFFFFTWETYYTGTLYLGYMNGPTEGLLSAIAAIISSALYGACFLNFRASILEKSHWLLLSNSFQLDK
jgi:ethanolaminephosphotransferase